MIVIYNYVIGSNWVGSYTFAIIYSMGKDANPSGGTGRDFVMIHTLTHFHVLTVYHDIIQDQFQYHATY